MAHHGPRHLTEADTRTPGGAAWPILFRSFLLGVVGLGLAGVLAAVLEATVGHGLRRLAFAYLIGFMFWLALALGCLFFVIITHLFRSGWCVMVRRVAENGAAALPMLAILALPLLLFAWAGDGGLYPWADTAMIHRGQTPGSHTPGSHTPGSAAHTTDLESGSHTPAPPSAHAPQHAVAGDAHAADPVETTHASPDPHAAAGHGGGVYGAPSAEMVTDFFFNADGTRKGKGVWLNTGFWTVRVVLYLTIWSAIALFYRRKSVAQDKSRDPALTNDRERMAPISVLAFGFTVTFGAFDLIMSLDPTWYSTIFGVYYFANAFAGGLCVIILAHLALQRRGLVPGVNTEHFHDLGKLLFAFVFFWGYIAYAQYVLIWYPSMPEVVYWFTLRGMTTDTAASQYLSGWTAIALVLLFGHLFIPFAFLMSRHVKRNLCCLKIASCWMLAMIALDLFWLIRPALSSGIGGHDAVGFAPLELALLAAVWVGIGGLTVGAAIRKAAAAPLVAHGDPRLHESLKLDTSAASPMPDLIH